MSSGLLVLLSWRESLCITADVDVESELCPYFLVVFFSWDVKSCIYVFLSCLLILGTKKCKFFCSLLQIKLFCEDFDEGFNGFRMSTGMRSL